VVVPKVIENVAQNRNKYQNTANFNAVFILKAALISKKLQSG
jgi:hypothetical protein